MEFRLRMKGRSTPIFVTTINTLPHLSRRSQNLWATHTFRHISTLSPTGSSLKGSLNLSTLIQVHFLLTSASIDHITSLPPLIPLLLTLQFLKSKFYFYNLNHKYTGFFYQHCLTQDLHYFVGQGRERAKGTSKQSMFHPAFSLHPAPHLQQATRITAEGKVEIWHSVSPCLPSTQMQTTMRTKSQSF